jgi:hypothetical protein
MAKATSEIKRADPAGPMDEELRKKLFPRVPPPTMKQLKERKNKKKS